MKKRREFKLSIIRRSLCAWCFLSVILVVAQGARAQTWEKLGAWFGEHSIHHPVYLTPYFVNSSYGFIYPYASGGYRDFLARTTDGGRTFDKLTYFRDSSLLISELQFVSPSHGFAATQSSFHEAPRGGIYETVDSGSSWKLVSPVANFHSLYAVDSQLFAIEALPGLLCRLLVSKDFGHSWDSSQNIILSDSFALHSINGHNQIVGNKDCLIAFLSMSSSNGPFGDPTYSMTFSTDKGMTWMTRSLVGSLPSWSAGSLITNVTMFVAPHDSRIALLSQQGFYDHFKVYVANSPYVDWAASVPMKIGNYLAGSSCVMYLPDANNDPNGLRRSLNGGLTWDLVPCPPDFSEIDDLPFPNMALVGHGSTLYATDVNGVLWKEIMPLEQMPPAYRFSLSRFPGIDTIQLQCHSSDTSILLLAGSTGCSYARLTSAEVIGLASDEYSMSRVHYHACSVEEDTLILRLLPKMAGMRNVTAFLHFTDDEFERVDTSINIPINVRGSDPSSLHLSLQSGTMNVKAGAEIDIAVLCSGSALSGENINATLPIELDTNVAEPIDFIPTTGVTLDGLNYRCNSGIASLRFNSAILAGATSLGSFRCKTLIGKSDHTFLRLGSPSLISDSQCLQMTSDETAVRVNFTGCGDSTLVEFMRMGSLVRIDRIVPNPARDEVRVSGVGFGAADVEIYDVMGREIRGPWSGVRGPGDTTPQPPPISLRSQEGEISLDVRGLPEGMYYLRIGTATSRFVIER